MFHTVAWFENGDFGAVDESLLAVPDESINTEGDFIRVPTELANLIAELAVVDADVVNSARIESPSLRQLANQDISPLLLQQELDRHGMAQVHHLLPRPLAAGESLEFVVNTDQNATPTESGNHWGVVWLGDGPQQPVSGNIFTVRATADAAQANGAWNSGQLTFSQRLPIANYTVVGMRVESSDAIAARLIFIGSVLRPGVPVLNGVSAPDFGMFRFGSWGNWGTFDLNQPPSLEVLGGTATEQDVFLDLIRAG